MEIATFKVRTFDLQREDQQVHVGVKKTSIDGNMLIIEYWHDKENPNCPERCILNLNNYDRVTVEYNGTLDL